MSVLIFFAILQAPWSLHVSKFFAQMFAREKAENMSSLHKQLKKFYEWKSAKWHHK